MSDNSLCISGYKEFGILNRFTNFKPTKRLFHLKKKKKGENTISHQWKIPLKTLTESYFALTVLERQIKTKWLEKFNGSMYWTHNFLFPREFIYNSTATWSASALRPLLTCYFKAGAVKFLQDVCYPIIWCSIFFVFWQ